jgi:hypothetical protein
MILYEPVPPTGAMVPTDSGSWVMREEAEQEIESLRAQLAEAKRGHSWLSDCVALQQRRAEEAERQREALRSLAVDVGGLCAREIQGGVCGLSSANHFSDCIPHIALAAAAAQEGKG